MKSIMQLVKHQPEIVAYEESEEFDTITRIGNRIKFCLRYCYVNETYIFVSLRSTHAGTLNKVGSIPGPRIRKRQIQWATTKLRKYLEENQLHEGSSK